MTFSFRLTQDEALIREAILSPNNLPWAFESHVSQLTWTPKITHGINYVACYKVNTFLGIFVTIHHTDSCCESHIAFLPLVYGKTAKLGREAIQWIWANMPYLDIVAPCVRGNSLASRFLTRIGFAKYGVREEPWVKDGKPYIMDLFRISKSII
jgi:RimJ/RimL family protein N-acetyltransferase